MNTDTRINVYAVEDVVVTLPDHVQHTYRVRPIGTEYMVWRADIIAAEPDTSMTLVYTLVTVAKSRREAHEACMTDAETFTVPA